MVLSLLAMLVCSSAWGGWLVREQLHAVVLRGFTASLRDRAEHLQARPFLWPDCRCRAWSKGESQKRNRFFHTSTRHFVQVVRSASSSSGQQSMRRCMFGCVEVMVNPSSAVGKGY